MNIFFSKTLRISFLLIMPIVLTLSVISCTKKQNDNFENNTVFRSYIKSNLKTLDPAMASDEASILVVSNIYDTLYQYSYVKEPYTIEPLIAMDIPQYSRDKKTVTIKIKPGILFQDDPCFTETKGRGRELVANDFVYAIKRLALPEIEPRSWNFLDGKIIGLNSFREKLSDLDFDQQKTALKKEPVLGIRAKDRYTVKIVLSAPYPQLLYVLSMHLTAPIPFEAFDAYADKNGQITKNAVGTGAFMLQDWIVDNKIVLKKNPTYNPNFFPTSLLNNAKKKVAHSTGKQLPLTEIIELSVIKEPHSAWEKFTKGELDTVELSQEIFPLALDDEGRLLEKYKAKDMALHIEKLPIFYYLNFNLQDTLLGSNKKIRQAISSVIDRNEWIKIASNMTGQKATSILPKNIPGHIKSNKLKYDYNPTRAQQLLKDAGHPNGKDIPSIRLEMRKDDIINRKLGEFFLQSLSKIGIQLKISYNTFPEFIEKMKNSHYQFAYGGWAMDKPHAEKAFQLFFGPLAKKTGPNHSNFNNDTYNKLYEKMAFIKPGTSRDKIIKQMEDIIQEETPWVLGYFKTTYTLSHKWVSNFRHPEMTWNTFKYYAIDKKLKKQKLKEWTKTHSK